MNFKRLAAAVIALMTVLYVNYASPEMLTKGDGYYISASGTNQNDFVFEIKNNEAVLTKYQGEYVNVVIPEKYTDNEGKEYKVTRIGPYAFEDCDYIESVIVPDSVIQIGSSAFAYCDNLKSVNIPSGLTVIPGDLFSGCRSLESITIPDSVTKIGDSAFESTGLSSSLIIPESVARIGNYAFSDTDIVSVVISGEAALGEDVFRNCSKLKKVKFKSEFSLRNEYIFSGCNNLDEVIVPCSMRDSFSGILDEPSLEELQHGVPVSYWVKEFHFFNSFDTCKRCEVKKYNYKINNGEAVLTKYYGNEEKVELPSSYTDSDGTEYAVTGIDSYALYDMDEIVSLTVPEGIKTIGYSAFNGCTSLKNVSVPESVENIERNIFYNCDPGMIITIPCASSVIDNPQFEKFQLNRIHELREDGTCVYCNPEGENFKFSTASLTLSEGLTLNYFISSDNKIKNKKISVSFKSDSINKTFVFSDEKYNEEAGGYTFSIPVRPDCITEKISAVISAGDNQVLASKEYSVKMYLDSLSADKKYTDLTESILRYCAYSQKYTGNNTDNMAAEVSDYSTDRSIQVSPPVISGSSSLLKSASLLLGSSVSLCIVYDIPENADFEFSCVEKNTEKICNIEKIRSGNKVKVYLRDIRPQDLDSVFIFTASDSDETVTLEYSALNYMYSVLSDAQSSQELRDLVNSLYDYNQEAEKFLAAQSGNNKEETNTGSEEESGNKDENQYSNRPGATKYIEYTIRWEEGLDVRKASLLQKIAIGFASDVHLYSPQKNTLANAKSMLEIINMNLSRGDIVLVYCEGPDEDQAYAAILEFFESEL